MQRVHTYSREDLQAAPSNYRKELVNNIIDSHIHRILATAKSGSTQYIFKSFTHDPNSGVRYLITPSPDELVEAFKSRLPNCLVEYTEEWEEVAPGMRHQKRQIKIDWS